MVLSRLNTVVRTSSMDSIPTLSAQLSVRRGRAAIDFYKRAFGALEDYRVGGTDQHEAVVAQLSIGNSTFWVADESPEHANLSPESLGGGSVRMTLIVEEPQAAIDRAVAAGATEVYAAGEFVSAAASWASYRTTRS
jgi:PhnB protein